MKLKILSWNIWIDGDSFQVNEFLKNSDADIIALQEVQENSSEQNVISFLKSLGYESVFAPVEKTWDGKIFRDGPAIFSKYKIENSEIFVLSEIDKRVAIKADIHIGKNLLHVFSTHFIHTHQEESELQKEQTEKLLKHVPSTNSVIMGDFNATPESSTIQNITKTLVDVDSDENSTWSVYPEGCVTCKPKGIDTKLDYIFTTPDIHASSFKVEISKASDHLPISCEVNL